MTTPPISPDGRSPLIIIRHKELEIAERLAGAKQAAEQTLLDARRAASAICDQAEREGRAAAAALLQEELAQADAAAERTRAQSASLADQIGERGAHRLDRAVQRILACVLPEIPGE